MKHIKYIPKNVCAMQIDIVLDGDIIRKVEFTGGCPGNANGLCQLVIGLPAQEVIKKLTGITCESSETSCPDQLAKALSEAVREKENL